MHLPVTQLRASVALETGVVSEDRARLLEFQYCLDYEQRRWHAGDHRRP